MTCNLFKTDGLVYHFIVKPFMHNNSNNCHKRPLKKIKIGLQDGLSLNAGQNYCIMLQESILQYFDLH